MQAYWAGLAASGTPGSGWSGATPLVWPEYALASRSSVHFATPSNALDSAYNGANCDFWDTQVGFLTY